MKNYAKKVWQSALMTVVIVFAIVVTGFTNAPEKQADSCPTPTVMVIGSGSNTIRFSMSTASEVDGFAVYYVRLSDNYTSQVTTTGGSTISFTNLQAGSYRFYFASVCGSETSGYINNDELIME